jgi:hypothetical protein
MNDRFQVENDLKNAKTIFDFIPAINYNDLSFDWTRKNECTRPRTSGNKRSKT